MRREKERETEKGTVKEKKKKKGKTNTKEKFINVTKEGSVGTAEGPGQQERQFERYVQEKHGGQHEGVRPQPEDHARLWTAWRTCMRRSRIRGPLWRRRPPRTTRYLLKRTKQWTNLWRPQQHPGPLFWMRWRALAKASTSPSGKSTITELFTMQRVST